MEGKRSRRGQTQRQSWNEDNMKKALEAVAAGLGKKTAARQFGVPVMTLKRRAFGKNISATSHLKILGMLLLLDGHLSHTKNLNVIIKARENFVTIICLPPHTLHKLQPLDVKVMCPLSHHYDKGLEKWLTNHPGHVITDYQVSTIFCEAYLMACSPKNAIKGFQNTGIHHYNPDIFIEEDFAPAKTTDENSENGDPDDPMRMERLTHTPQPESHKL
ncbi:hypothetical protein PR048_014483 [Dryococelus australis]|uniref:HTH psq-type domain-containing protein n=1 Tax=Dryococelus australis TaxID=614101 RepID=A0ABQ9HEB8_9NEOP|nr:hypothetical protein PR048_014483 [Dryococelus australis]